VSDASERLLRQYEAEREIQRVILEYALGVDANDWERVRACFFEDAIIRYGDLISGTRDEIMDWLEEKEPVLIGRAHYFGPPLIDLDLDGGSARTELWCINTNRFAPDEAGKFREAIAGLSYQDRFELRDGRWKISERRNSTDWQGYLSKE